MKEFIKIYIESYKNFEDNSNANIVNDTKESRLSISDNKKTCLECNKVFDLKQFFFSDKKNKIFLNNCILCYEKKHGDSKQCSKCEIIKNKLDYVVDRTKKDGLTYDCKECRYEQTKKRKEEIKKENPNIGKKQCITCKNFEMVKLFYKIKINEIHLSAKNVIAKNTDNRNNVLRAKKLKFVLNLIKKQQMQMV